MRGLRDDLLAEDRRHKNLNDKAQRINERIDDLSDKKITDRRLSSVREGLQKIMGECSNLGETVANILKTLNEDINIIVVGSTSTGKSKIINAIVGRNIMLSSAYHTTRCFFRITNDRKNYIEYPGNLVVRCSNAAKVEKRLTNDLRNSDMIEDVEIKVFLRIESPIFQKNVYLTDTPGLGKTDAVTNSVAEKCTEMDIMIFVMNYNISKDSQTTIQRLTGVMSKIPTFILINRWDQTDEDCTEDLDKTKKTIIDGINKCMSCSDKKIRTSAGDAQRRHFYISGKEMAECNGVEPYDGDKRKRYREFKQFEKNLANLIRGTLGDKERRHNDNFEEIKKSFNGICKDFSNFIETLKSTLKGRIS